MTIDYDALVERLELVRTYHNVDAVTVREGIDAIAALRARLLDAQTVRDEWCADYTKARDERDALRAEVEALRKWIKEKGRHHIACMKLDMYDERDHGCTCGYDAAMEEKS